MSLHKNPLPNIRKPLIGRSGGKLIGGQMRYWPLIGALILCQIVLLNTLSQLTYTAQGSNGPISSSNHILFPVAWAQSSDPGTEPELAGMVIAGPAAPLTSNEDESESGPQATASDESSSGDTETSPTTGSAAAPLDAFESTRVVYEDRRPRHLKENRNKERDEDPIEDDLLYQRRYPANHTAEAADHQLGQITDDIKKKKTLYQKNNKQKQNKTKDANQLVKLEKKSSGQRSLDLSPSTKEEVLFDGDEIESQFESKKASMDQFPLESHKIELNSNCALILKRTYIIKSPPSGDEWGDKFVFNDVDSDSAAGGKRRVHKSDVCIKHSDVDKAIEEAKHKIKFERPSDLDSADISEASIGSVGELNLATSQILTQKFDLSHDEILNALPMIDMSSSKFFTRDLCPQYMKAIECSKSRYRTITAHCNNLKHPSWGAFKTPYSRYLPPDYADGLTLPRAGRDGQPLPSARLITSVVHRDIDEPSNDYTVLFASWGQLLNHDVTRHASVEAPDCCPQYLKGNCMPIPVPENDPHYSRFNVKCLKFDRSIAAIRPKCLLGLRAQINLVTAPVDASFVYGSSKSQAAKLRKFVDGKLKSWNYFEKLKLKPLLPPQTEMPDKECLGRPKNLFCFEAGDVRANEQTHLTVLHTVYMREHNRIAKQLARMNLEWDDDKVYHETRHIVAAGVQHVVVNEFLPLVLGHKYTSEYKIKPAEGFWPGYDPAVTTSTGTGFAAAAFRYGHSMVEGVIKRFDKKGHFVKGEKLRYLFKRPFLLYEPGVLDELIMGLALTPTEQTDPWVSEEISGYLFKPPKAEFGHDLPAINIQRGRDQGVPGYNDWREWCGLPRAKSFSDLEPLLMNRTAFHYSRIYRHVDDIDLWSAGVSERHLPGSAVGPTMACIISRQFLNTKRGDRFWYENPNQPSSFTAEQLKEIKKITLAKILCTNADDIPRIQPWAMRLPHPIYNAKVSCDALPSIDLKLWDSSRAEEK